MLIQLSSPASIFAETPGATASEILAREAVELLRQSKFADAADRYQLAAKAARQEPGGESKVKRYLANYHLYRAMGIYSEGELSGHFGKADLDEAAKDAGRARDLFGQIGNRGGEQAGEGWRLLLVGVRHENERQFNEAREAYEKARGVFIDLGESAPR